MRREGQDAAATPRRSPVPAAGPAASCALLVWLALASCQQGSWSGAVLQGQVTPPPGDAPGNQVSQLRINEVMVTNASTLADERGAYPPWVELYNPTESPVDLSGIELSDDAGAPGKWAFPAGPASVVPPHGHLVVFCDGRATAASALHAGFTLAPGPLELILNRGSDVFMAEGSGLRPDQSIGRAPDGGSAIGVLKAPTPGDANAELLPRRGGARGDVDRSGVVDVTDAIDILDYLFRDAFVPDCEPAADVNDDGQVDIGDPVRILDYLFLGGLPLPDLTPEDLEACGRNAPPALVSRPLYHAFPRNAVEFALEATDPEDDRLLYEAIDAPPGAVLEEDTGVVRWLPGENQVGPFYFSFIVSDEAVPPNRVAGRVAFQVHPLHPCIRPECDPATGCEAVPVPLSEDCCGGPGPRLPDAELDCPQGAFLHVGRNQGTSPTIGRLENCDLLQLVSLGQGGHVARLHLQARCLVRQQVRLEFRLETAAVVLFQESVRRDLEATPGGLLEIRNLRLVAEGPFLNGTEALLSFSAEDSSGLRLERKLRLVITREAVPDLP